MEPYQQRVVDEKADLDVKLDALTAFLESETRPSIHPKEHERMQAQANAMQEYSAILGRRIAAFTVKDTPG